MPAEVREVTSLVSGDPAPPPPPAAVAKTGVNAEALSHYVYPAEEHTLSKKVCIGFLSLSLFMLN